jgi:hypothetical protein
MYDNELGLNYRGEESYKTSCGACFTLFIAFFLANVALVGLKRMWLRNEPERREHVLMMDEEMWEENGLMELTHHRFNIAIEMRYQGKSIKLKPEYGSLSFY